MILSRTLDGPLNLNLMTLETPKISPVYDPVRLYKDLKKTPLYDLDFHQWNCVINMKQERGNTARHTDDQLLDILIISEFEPHAIKGAYEKLKESKFYEKLSERWNTYVENGHGVGGLYFDIEARLMEILVISKFDKGAAKNTYENLKNTLIYDKDLDQWNRDVRYHEQIVDQRLARNQLLGLLVLSEFDLDAAKKSYMHLQSTVLYDKKHLQLFHSMDKRQQAADSSRYAQDQLLHTLVLYNFNMEEARCNYERLKMTPLFDAELKQWNRVMDWDQLLESSDRDCSNQLLAVLIEAKLAKAFPPETSLSENLPALPDIWRAK